MADSLFRELIKFCAINSKLCCQPNTSRYLETHLSIQKVFRSAQIMPRTCNASQDDNATLELSINFAASITHLHTKYMHPYLPDPLIYSVVQDINNLFGSKTEEYWLISL